MPNGSAVRDTRPCAGRIVPDDAPRAVSQAGDNLAPMYERLLEMIEARFSTDDLPKAERWASWCDASTRQTVPSLIHTENQDDFRGVASLLNLGAVKVSVLTFSPLHMSRTPKLIRQSDPDVYLLGFFLRGQLGFTHSGLTDKAGHRDLVLLDSSRPYWGGSAHDRAISCLVVAVPRHLIPIRSDTFRRLVAVRISGREGLGALLARHLIGTVRNTVDFTMADAVRLGTVVVDLLAALCAHELEAVSALPAETQRRALHAQILEFIERRLGDPDLSPDAVAAAHRISSRYLYLLFQEQGLTVAGWIRQRRLDRCRHDLTDPGQRASTIHAIGARWGFTDAAHFSRVFRAAYGMSPRDYRHLLPDGRT